MSTITAPTSETPTKSRKLVEMNWDPITRIVGSLGIFTKIDFENREVAECHSTSSIFRGYGIFMKGKDPRDTHFIASRICGICSDNHATCAGAIRTARRVHSGATLYFEHNADRNSIRIAGHPPTNPVVISTLQSEYWQALSPRFFLALVELVLAHDRFTIDISCDPMSGSKHRSTRRHNRRKAHKTDRLCDVVINCFHSAAH